MRPGVHPQLKTAREAIVLAHEPLYPLSSVVEVACSDDETDKDDAQQSSIKANTTPRLVRELTWHSDLLRSVFVGLDEYRTRCTNSIPKNTHARPPRPRLRISKGPISEIKAPVGLPVDCYSEQWLRTLTPFETSQIDAKQHPILQPLLSIVKSL